MYGFAESEVIRFIGRGEKRENIAFAAADPIGNKTVSQAGRPQLGRTTVCSIGGLCDIDYLREPLAKAIGVTVLSHENGRYAGAISVALSAFMLPDGNQYRRKLYTTSRGGSL